jgi:electron transfer flavoprotein alpha subunit
MAQDVLVFCEQRAGELRTIAFECVAAGRSISSRTGGKCIALKAGPAGGTDEGKLAWYGAEKVLTVGDESLARYSPELLLQVLTAAVGETSPAVVIFGATSLGKDLAPRLSTKLGVGIAPDCTHLAWDEGKLVATRPIYAGKAVIKLRMNGVPAVVSVRPKAFAAGEPDENASCEITPLVVTLDKSAAKYDLKEIQQSGGAAVDLTEADIIVSGGRGMKAAENFKLIEELADALGGVVGASRAVVDADWRPHSEQVGQTGKVVSPTLYIACGISGAIQHVAGMRSSKTIVAINKDKEAPIFSLADYGVVGDTLEVLPVMIEKIRALKAGD